MNKKILALYLSLYGVAISLMVYGWWASKELVLSGISLVVFVTPAFAVFLYTQRKRR